MPRNQIKDSSTHLLRCSVLTFWQLRLVTNCRYNFLRYNSFPSRNCKLGAGLFISIYGGPQVSRQKQKLHGKNKNSTAKTKTPRQKQKPPRQKQKHLRQKQKPLRQKQKPHGKNKNLYGKNKNLYGKNKNLYGKNKNLYGKNKNLTAKTKTLRQKQKLHGKNKNSTAKTKTSRQKQKPHGKKYIHGKSRKTAKLKSYVDHISRAKAIKRGPGRRTADRVISAILTYILSINDNLTRGRQT